MPETRPIWTKPQLVILARQHPEEAVLEACKLDYDGPNASTGCADVGGGCPTLVAS